MSTLEYYIERSEQKLRFARIHLEELRTHPSRNTGDDFERAHHEAFLFQFYGATDAFLQELNIYYSTELQSDKVSRREMKMKLKKMGVISTEFAELTELEANADSFLSNAAEMRHHATHRGGIPMQHNLNAASYLVHPITQKSFQTDALELFGGWLDRLTALLEHFRATARAGGAHKK
jgi:hypothetical protein